MIEGALARRESGHPPLIVTAANARVVAMCARDQDICALFLGADAIYADSMPLLFASRLFATPCPSAWQPQTCSMTSPN
jgi:UDP-N-acetyl-D-mannosaminuronic acid transferase (WecB/TagA/CpsF family)